MALRAGYYGLKRKLIDKLSSIAGSYDVTISGKVDKSNLEDFTQISTDITDFVGKWKIIDGVCFGIVSYTKKGSSYTVARIPKVKIYNDITNFVVGVGASTKNVVLVSSGTDLVLQEQITTDQTNKTVLSFSFPIAIAEASRSEDDNRLLEETNPELSVDEPVVVKKSTRKSITKKTEEEE